MQINICILKYVDATNLLLKYYKFSTANLYYFILIILICLFLDLQKQESGSLLFYYAIYIQNDK